MGKWLGMAGPAVTVALEFAADGTVRVTAAPGSAPTCGRYAVPAAGHVTITSADGRGNLYRFLIEGQILTMEPAGGAPQIFRRAP